MSAATDRELRRIADALALLALHPDAAPPRGEEREAFFGARAALRDRVVADVALPVAPVGDAVLSSLPPVTSVDALVVFVGDAELCIALSSAVQTDTRVAVALFHDVEQVWRGCVACNSLDPLRRYGASGAVAVHLLLHEPAHAVAFEAIERAGGAGLAVVVGVFPRDPDGAIPWECRRGAGAPTAGRWRP